MALNKNAKPEFENNDDDGETAADPVQTPAQRLQAAANARKEAAEAAAETAKKPDTKPEPKASASRDVAAAGSGAVVTRTVMSNPLEPLKNAFFCEFDTLRGLKLSSGNIIDNQTNKPLGDEVGLELLSYQDQWVISPGVDGDEGKEHVRYSDDGITTSKGEDCKGYLQSLKAAGFEDAKLSKRTVIAGSLFYIGTKGEKELKDLQDELVQISLAPTSKANFDRYMMGQAFKIGKGLITPDGAPRIRITAEPVSRNKKDWTQAAFSRWDGAQ